LLPTIVLVAKVVKLHSNKILNVRVFVFVKIHADGSDRLLQKDDKRSSDIPQTEQRGAQRLSAAAYSVEGQGLRCE
jgi:hypothetical protein